MFDFDATAKVLEILREKTKIEAEYMGYSTLGELRYLHQENNLKPGVYLINTSGTFVYFDGKELRFVTRNGLY